MVGASSRVGTEQPGCVSPGFAGKSVPCAEACTDTCAHRQCCIRIPPARLEAGLGFRKYSQTQLQWIWCCPLWTDMLSGRVCFVGLRIPICASRRAQDRWGQEGRRWIGDRQS